jgi:hypothetical protein
MATIKTKTAKKPAGAKHIVRALKFKPHPEGGHYRETWRDEPGQARRGRHKPEAGERGAGTAIYYLLQWGEESRWHRIDAVEIWHHYSGAALALNIMGANGRVRTVRLGSKIHAGEKPQAIVPKGAWQSAKPLGDWSLVGCTVSPAFDFAGFEMAPENVTPGRRRR